jgi:hypothetical protein
LLSQTAVRAWRPEFAVAAAAVFDRLRDHDPIDDMSDIAEPFPPPVFGDAICLPVEGRENLIAYGNTVFNTFGPRNQLFDDAVVHAAGVAGWIAKHCERARRAGTRQAGSTGPRSRRLRLRIVALISTRRRQPSRGPARSGRQARRRCPIFSLGFFLSLLLRR